MELNALVVVLKFTNHATVDVVVEHVTHGVGSDGRGQMDGFAVELLTNAAQGFDTDDFTVCKLQPSNVYAAEFLAEFLNPVEFLLPSLLQERMVKFRCDAVHQAPTDGQVVLHQGFVCSHGFVDPHSLGYGAEGERRGCGVAEHPSYVEHSATKTLELFFHGVALFSPEQH